MKKGHAILFIILTVVCSGAAAQGTKSAIQSCETGGTAWTHNPVSPRGPECWQGLADPPSKTCADGKEQSPILIDPTGLPTDPTRISLHYTPFEAEVWNTGHVVEVCAYEGAHHDTGCAGTKSLGGYIMIGADRYDLKEFHMHAPAEHHLLRSPDAPLEVHLVHVSKTAKRPNAVIGVWMKLSREGNPLITAVVDSPKEAKVKVNPYALLTAKGVGQYYSYSGSLTTPGCSQTVAWMVAKETGEVDERTLGKLHTIIKAFPGYDGYPDNNRPVQKRNDRKVALREIKK